MNDAKTQALLEELVKTVVFLCEETASLVEERTHRTPEDGQAGVLGKAEQIRLSADSLRATLEALRRTK